MGTLTRTTMAILVCMCLWASANVPQARIMLDNITPNVLREYAGPAPKAIAAVKAATESLIQAEQ